MICITIMEKQFAISTLTMTREALKYSRSCWLSIYRLVLHLTFRRFTVARVFYSSCEKSNRLPSWNHSGSHSKIDFFKYITFFIHVLNSFLFNLSFIKKFQPLCYKFLKFFLHFLKHHCKLSSHIYSKL